MPRFSGGTTFPGSEIVAPSSAMLPAVGFMNPAIIRNVVVLPQPDGPNRDTNSPGCSARSTPTTAGTDPKFLPRPINESLAFCAWLIDAPGAA